MLLLVGAIQGFLRTYRRLKRNLYWEGMKGDLQLFVQACDVCQSKKYAVTPPQGQSQLLPILIKVWSDISLDFILGLPKSLGFDVVFVIPKSLEY